MWISFRTITLLYKISVIESFKLKNRIAILEQERSHIKYKILYAYIYIYIYINIYIYIYIYIYTTSRVIELFDNFRVFVADKILQINSPIMIRTVFNNACQILASHPQS